VAGKTLSWALNGQSNTVDHFQIFISLDGVNLMRLATVATSARALDLSTFSLAPGAYKLFVQAVGKPFLTNKMSGAASYSVANTPPTISLSATPTTGAAILLVSASTAGSKDPDGTLASSRLDFGDGTVLSAASGSHNYSKSGTYVLKATVTDNLGASSSTSATITVKPPTLVTISSPLNNATVGRNVTVSGKATSSVTISLMQIYLDGAKSYQIAGSSVSKSLSLSAGTHRITIQSVDINGALAKSTINVTAK